MNKTFKKVLSVVLSLAMIVTSITVYNTTAKADVTEVVVTATKRDNYDGIDASWTTPDVEFATLGCYLNKSGEEAFDEAHYATASNDHCWSKINNTEARTTLDTVVRTDDSSLKITNGGDYVIVVRYYDADGNVVAQGTSNVITYAEYVTENKTLNLTVVDKEKGAITGGGPRFNWDLVSGAVKYRIDALKADGTSVKNWSLGENVKTLYYWGSDVKVETVGAATYTLRVRALDSDGNVITEESITDVPAYIHVNATLGVAYGPGTATLKWKAITYATTYKVTVGSTVNDVTTTSVTVDVEENVEYAAKVQAFDANGDEITITNNTTTVKYVPETAPDDNKITNVDTSSWTKLAVKKGTVESEYYINSAHGLSTDTWFGIYAPHSDASYHNREEACNIPDGVAAFEFKDSNVTAIWVNQRKYEKGSNVFTMRNDQAEISVDALPVGQNVITLVYSDGTMKTFAIKTVATIKINGEEIQKVEEVTDYTLPTEAAYGYYCDGKMYKSGSTVTVKTSMNFTAVKTLSVSISKGAGIRIDGTSGIRFKATVSTNNEEALKSDAITEGMLITASDIRNGADLTLDSKYQKIEITNSGWYKDEVGTYCGSIINIAEGNYARAFVARSYVIINYENSPSEVIYSTSHSEDRSVAQVAKAVQGSEEYSTLTGTPKDWIDKYASKYVAQ